MLVLDVLQVLLAEIVHRHALRELVAEQCPRRLRDENLAAVARGGDARRADDVDPEVPLVADVRLARVQPHAHAKLLPLGPLVQAQRPLRLHGPGGGVACPQERVEERVALRVDLRAAVLAERRPDDPPVIGGDGRVDAVAELLQQPRRALDVGEGEGDGSAGQLRHRPTLAG